MKYLLDLTSVVSMPKGSEWERTEQIEGGNFNERIQIQFLFSVFLIFMYCIIFCVSEPAVSGADNH